MCFQQFQEAGTLVLCWMPLNCCSAHFHIKICHIHFHNIKQFANATKMLHDVADCWPIFLWLLKFEFEKISALIKSHLTQFDKRLCQMGNINLSQKSYRIILAESLSCLNLLIASSLAGAQSLLKRLIMFLKRPSRSKHSLSICCFNRGMSSIQSISDRRRTCCGVSKSKITCGQ